MVPVTLSAGPIAYGSLRGNIALEVILSPGGMEAGAKEIIEALQRGAVDMSMRFTMIVIRWESIDAIDPNPENLDSVEELIAACTDLGMYVILILDGRYRFPFLDRANYVIQRIKGEVLPYKCQEVWYEPNDPDMLQIPEVHENAVKVFILDQKIDAGNLAVFIRETHRSWRIESAPKYRLKWPIYLG